MSEERRRYFRIDDTVGVYLRRLTPEEVSAFAARNEEHGGNFDLASNFDNRIHTLLDACRIQNPVAAELLDLMNKKLNFVIQQMDVDSEILHNIAYELKQVNISACGMALATDERYQSGEAVQVELSLKPSELRIVLMARVIDCDLFEQPDSAETRFFLRLEFSHINANDQELLIQHVVKKQSNQLKERRKAQ